MGEAPGLPGPGQYQDAAWETRLVRAGDGDLAAFQPGAGVTMGYDDLKVVEAGRLGETITTGAVGATIEDAVFTAGLVDSMVPSYDEKRWVRCESTSGTSGTSGTVQVGVVGVGAMGTSHVQTLAGWVPGATVTAVFDADVARARRLPTRSAPVGRQCGVGGRRPTSTRC